MKQHLGDLLAIARDRGARLRKSGDEYVGPCPKCGGDDRFAISAKRKLWNCRRCQVGGSVVDLLMHLDGLSYREAVAQLGGDAARRTSRRREVSPANSAAHARRSDCSHVNSNKNDVVHALSIWGDAIDLHGTPALTYLNKRGVNLGNLPPLQHVLRWHPRCRYGNREQPCIIALWTDAITCAARAIHRRPISPAGEKLDIWRALGPTTGCVIRLWPDEDVTHGLVVAEGVETALVAATRVIHKGTLLQPIWATGDAGHMAVFPILPGIESMTLLVDHDENRAGQKAAAKCAERQIAAGREVVRLTPRVADSDFADIVASEVASA
jgi:Toprim domain/CHC2 zinc finger